MKGNEQLQPKATVLGGKNRGQLQLEAIICLACFFALLSVSLHSLSQVSLQSSAAADAIAAKSNSLLCSTLIDSMYSNSAAQLAEEKLPCAIAQDGKVKSVVRNKEKSANSIPENVKLVQVGNRTIVSVELNEHYR